MKTPEQILAEAMEHEPVAALVGFSGGRDSLAVTHWAMNNVEGCEVLHVNTGIGIERTREYVRDTCKAQGWPLHEVRAKEDCGMDYREIVLKHGFPGPDSHSIMYSSLKERCIRHICRQKQSKRGERILLLMGARYEESVRRMGYAGKEVTRNGREVWVNPIYWWSADDRDEYNRQTGIPINPIAAELGMSGECLCGAYAHKGEKDLVRMVDPETAEYLDALEQEALALGFTWSWEGSPPKGGRNKDQVDAFMPMCVGCEK